MKRKKHWRYNIKGSRYEQKCMHKKVFYKNNIRNVELQCRAKNQRKRKMTNEKIIMKIELPGKKLCIMGLIWKLKPLNYFLIFLSFTFHVAPGRVFFFLCEADAESRLRSLEWKRVVANASIQRHQMHTQIAKKINNLIFLRCFYRCSSFSAQIYVVTAIAWKRKIDDDDDDDNHDVKKRESEN